MLLKPRFGTAAVIFTHILITKANHRAESNIRGQRNICHHS